jgi:NADPH-dependent 2,4-dienoyl-CoA reductase/sulfur reductase-like enzyme
VVGPSVHRWSDKFRQVPPDCQNRTVSTAGPVNGRVSNWFTEFGSLRPKLPGNLDADVCIVGAGYTGLWTAYYLKRADP